VASYHAGKPSKPMVKEAIDAGRYTVNSTRGIPKIQILTVEGLLAGNGSLEPRPSQPVLRSGAEGKKEKQEEML